MLDVDLDLAQPGGRAEAEAAVDRALGDGQHREREAGRRGVAEVVGDQPAQQPAPAVGRGDGDVGDHVDLEQAAAADVDPPGPAGVRRDRRVRVGEPGGRSGQAPRSDGAVRAGVAAARARAAGRRSAAGRSRARPPRPRRPAGRCSGPSSASTSTVAKVRPGCSLTGPTLGRRRRWPRRGFARVSGVPSRVGAMAKASAAEVEAGGRAVRVSSPDRVIYEATDRTPEVTKLMVAQYVASVEDGLMRALRDRPTALERWPSGVREGMKLATGPQDRDADAFYQKRVPKGAPDYLETVQVTFPSGPHRRGDLPDRDRGAGVVRAHGHDRLPPVAGAPHRRRPPRRAADRPRPPARHDVRRRGARGRRGPRAARGARARRLPEDLGQPRRPHLRADRAALGVHRPAARRDRVRPRARAPRRRRHHRLVEGGAGGADLRRLQPEQPRPHHRLGLLAAPAARAPRSRRRSPGASSPALDRPARAQPVHGARPGRRRRPVGGDRRHVVLPRAAAAAVGGAARAASSTSRPTTPRCRASRRGCSRRRRWPRTGTTTATGSRGPDREGRRARPPRRRPLVGVPRLLPAAGRRRRRRPPASPSVARSRLPSGWSPLELLSHCAAHGAALVRVELPRRGRRRPVGRLGHRRPRGAGVATVAGRCPTT